MVKWDAGIPDQVRQLALHVSVDGLTDDEVAKELGVSVPTVRRWKKKHPEFAAALAEVKDLRDLRVERSLYKRAIGYKYQEVETTIVNGVEVKRQVRLKVAHPDANACRLWLQNRQPEKWRDRQEVSVDMPTWLPEDTEIYRIVGDLLAARMNRKQ
ncbi:MAG: helix-turn-helix domain-containing protein [Methanoculleus sp.]